MLGTDAEFLPRAESTVRLLLIWEAIQELVESNVCDYSLIPAWSPRGVPDPMVPTLASGRPTWPSAPRRSERRRMDNCAAMLRIASRCETLPSDDPDMEGQSPPPQTV